MTIEKDIKIDHEPAADNTSPAADTGSSQNKKPEKEKSVSNKKLKKLKEKIDVLETELILAVEAKIQSEDQMKRVVAEFENMKKRQQREYNRALVFARENLVQELLPILDDLERSVQFDTANPEEKPQAENHSHQIGIKMIYERFLKYLQAVGVERFESVGELFDPELHDAVLTRSDDSVEAGIVLESFQPGYKMGNRILRHAKVVVSE